MRFLTALAVALCVAVSPALAAEPAALAKARQRYNAGDFDGAISAAAVARNIPSSADAASLVIARAHLERYRQRADPADLVDRPRSPFRDSSATICRPAIRSICSSAWDRRCIWVKCSGPPPSCSTPR